MARYHYRDRDDSLAPTITGLLVGALAGFAVGVITAQRVGGISGLASRVREHVRGVRDEMLRPDFYDDEFEEDYELRFTNHLTIGRLHGRYCASCERP
jgi:hypothetical protein